jgi:CRISPR-associated endonuclease/helicase Cas3
MILYAHSRSGLDEKDWQPLREHLENVAELSLGFANKFDMGHWAEAAGLLHDYGKASLNSQKRLRGEGYKVDHSTAGAQRAVREFGPAGRLVAACIAGHHAGLSDGIGPDESCLAKRLVKTDIPDSSACDNLIRINGPLPKLSLKVLHPDRYSFQIAFLTRKLFSCLVDADFLDTERFMDPEKAVWRNRFPPLETIALRFRKNLSEFIGGAHPSEINHRRKEILDACLAGAGQPKGLFTLTVPTGGGKTISSLAFAIEHALRYGLDRIIYVIPFTSIIEQNANIFRNFLGEDAVLEHHSTFDSDRLSSDGGSEADERKRIHELAAENWDAPIIATTSVQFFESLFSSRSSRCRKLHRIARSVVILDEAQMIPTSFLLPCIEAMRELAENYGATIVLCTATQPALSRRDDFRFGLEGVREIAPSPRALYEVFRRVKVEECGELSGDELAARLAEHEQVLCIVNTRSAARDIYTKLEKAGAVFHLSALMCAEHRSMVISEIKARLKARLSCRVISTQLIEAGVDIDLPVVYREVAGLDSVAQAAGRCNREGKLLEFGRVFLFSLKGRVLPGSFRAAAESAIETMLKNMDPLSPEAIEEFFRLLFWRKGEDGLDREGVLKKLAESAGDLYFPFRSVSEVFRLIRDIGETVLIPFDEKARGLIRQLQYSQFPGNHLRKLQRYTVQAPTGSIETLRRAGYLRRVQDIYPVLTETGLEVAYSDKVGLMLGEPVAANPESLII